MSRKVPYQDLQKGDNTMTRADRIFQILKLHPNQRMKVRDIVEKLSQEEDVPNLHPAAVTSTVRSENQSKDTRGETPRFNHSGDGTEERGYIAIREKKESVRSIKAISENYYESIPEIIEKANAKAKSELKKAITELTWQEFENNFLEQILDALGFSGIQITQRTRDGGKDAECQYKRGLVNSKAIVSAKHWKGKKIGPDEVQRLRGLKGDTDTGVIVTSNSFSGEAIKEAEPSQNQRSIVLIDIDIIVDTCFTKEIGVDKVSVQSFFRFSGFNNDSEQDIFCANS
ncbi:MAG: restriction endonuclease [Candidatus Electrothrix sp. ATG1]|nr:restriction endonuclease [Candidatus Electrothrix sp. ATG1]